MIKVNLKLKPRNSPSSKTYHTKFSFDYSKYNLDGTWSEIDDHQRQAILNTETIDYLINQLFEVTATYSERE